jgi:hypothetical protein
MAILKPKRGSGLPSGLQQHELAIDVLNRRIYLGNTGGTGDIVSSHITDYVSTLNSATGAVNLYAGSGLSVATSTAIKGITFTNTGVLSIDSATGAITNVARTNVAQTFSGLQQFTNGISSAGGTFVGTINYTSIIPGTELRLSPITIRTNGGLSIRGATGINASVYNELDLRQSAPMIVSSRDGIVIFDIGVASRTITYSTGLRFLGANYDIFPEVSYSTALIGSMGSGNTVYLPSSSGTLALTTDVTGLQRVTSFNGLTGAVTGVTTGTANTFGPVQSFTNGISASGGVTFANDIRINNFIVGRGGGNVTTNTAFGVFALSANTSGNANSAFGNNALAAVTTGSGNVGVGRRALLANTTGGNNVSIGGSSLISFNGNETVAIGTSTGGALQSGTGNIYIGFQADSSSTNPVNEIVIAPITAGLGSNTTIIGPSTQTLARINGLLDIPSGISSAGGTFSSLTRFTSGISASGGTFSGTVSSSGFILTSDGIKALTGTTYTFLASDNGDVITHDNASGCTFTIPTGLPVGFSTTVIRLNANGRVGFLAASGVTMNSYGGFTGMAGQHASASIISYGTNIYNLSGNLI